MSTHRSPHRLDLAAASEVVGLPPLALEALIAAGYLNGRRSGPTGSGPSFETADLKAFVARNADNGTGGALLGALAPDLEPIDLAQLLEARAEHMALRLFKMYATVFPEAADWPGPRQNKFVQHTRRRFEAMLAITALGDRFDREFYDDLNAIGASAAKAGVRLPEMLTLLRVSRDLVVQNAVDLAGKGERSGAHALSLLLTRILPAMDRIGDALTAGYWDARFPH